MFPVSGGWLKDLTSDSNMKVMQMFPVPFMGVGANYRRLVYTDSGKYDDLELTGKYTLSDLKKWNNLAVEVLLG